MGEKKRLKSEEVKKSAEGKKRSKSAVKEKKPVESDGNGMEEEYEVEKILDERKVGKKKEYFVKWKGWNRPEDNTWEPMDSLEGSKKLLKDYEKRMEEIEKKKKSMAAMGEDSDGSDGVEILEDAKTKTPLPTQKDEPKSAKKKGRPVQAKTDATPRVKSDE